MRENKDSNKIRDFVRKGYADIAQKGKNAEHEVGRTDTKSCCCGTSGSNLTQNIGYRDKDLKAIPGNADMGLSCGNPTALASLKEGETVLDLGSGGGLDVFIAGPKVGARGRVIGVDMTADMISRARNGIPEYQKRTGLDNVEFRLGEIEHIPVADNSVDVVISNCVINLSPDKEQVWREIARVLKPGGRVAISDLALLQPLPEEILAIPEAYNCCVAGAVLIEENRRMITKAGLIDIELTPKPRYVEAMTEWQDPVYKAIAESIAKDETPADYITSLDISARKPK